MKGAKQIWREISYNNNNNNSSGSKSKISAYIYLCVDGPSFWESHLWPEQKYDSAIHKWKNFRKNISFGK